MTDKHPLLLLIILYLISSEVKAQSIELLGGNVLNGAVTGSMLGAATVGLQDSNDFTPLRIGVGAGTIAGAAIAIYDIATVPRGEQFFISGVFNDGNNTSIIILLDTFYGAAAGAVLGSAGMLIADRPIVEGLQYGSSVGAWAGFGFGLLDAFIISQRNRDFIGASLMNQHSILEKKLSDYTIGLIQPKFVKTTKFSEREVNTSFQPVMGIFSLRMDM